MKVSRRGLFGLLAAAPLAAAAAVRAKPLVTSGFAQVTPLALDKPYTFELKGKSDASTEWVDITDCTQAHVYVSSCKQADITINARID